MSDETTQINTTEWTLTWRGRSWALDDSIVGAEPITGAQVFRVSMELNSDSWDAMNPARSPTALMTWLAVLIADAADGDLAAAYLEVTSAAAAELVRAISYAAPTPAPSMNGTG